MRRIDSAHNPKVAFAAALSRGKAADAFVVEGKRGADEIPPGWPVEFFLATDAFIANNGVSAYESIGAVYAVSEAAFRKASATETPQGVLAVCRKKDYGRDFAYILRKAAPLLVALDRVADPGNLGAVWRTADAAGADGVICSPGCADAYNPKVLRAAAGSVFHTPVLTGAELTEWLPRLEEAGVVCYGASLSAEEHPYGLPLQEGAAFVIGSEASGLDARVAALCRLIKLPMIGKAESLNAAVACGALLYEAVRQRLRYPEVKGWTTTNPKT